MIRVVGSRQEEIYGESYEDIPRRIPNIDKMRRVLGVTAETTLDEGLRRTIEYFRHASPVA